MAITKTRKQYSAGIPVDDWDDSERRIEPRIIVLEYQDGRPFAAHVRYKWDHTASPWFVEGRDRPTGCGYATIEFEWSKRFGQLYWHNGGGGGLPGGPDDDDIYEHVASQFVKPIPPPGKLWVADGVRVVDWRKNPLDRSQLLAMGTVLIARPISMRRFWSEWTLKPKRGEVNPFVVAEGDTECVYCKICNDYFPDELENVCEHLEWDDDKGCWMCNGEEI